MITVRSEIAILDDPALKSQVQATRKCRQHRLVRMYFEAYDQGGVLTVLDLSLILGVSQKVICGHIHAYEQETEQSVPIRATVHDIGSSVTHKAEVVRRFLRNESPDRVARATHHSQACGGPLSLSVSAHPAFGPKISEGPTSYFVWDCTLGSS